MNHMPLYDRAHLAGFTGGDEALEREILGDFCANARAHLAAVLAADTLEAWRDRAHKLKGAARGVGVWRIAELAQAAEDIEALSGDVADRLDRRVTALIDELQAALR